MARQRRSKKPARDLTAIVVCFGFAAIFIVAGGLLFWFPAREMTRNDEVGNWPTTGGVIEGIERSRQSSPRVVYTYSVGGRVFRSGKIALGSNSSGQARVWAETYRPGQAVRVHYDANDPSLSVLQTDPPRGQWIFPALGAAFLTVGVMAARFFARELL